MRLSSERLTKSEANKLSRTIIGYGNMARFCDIVNLTAISVKKAAAQFPLKPENAKKIREVLETV